MKAALFASPSTLGFFSSGEPAAGKCSLLNLAALQAAVSGIPSAGNETGGTSRRSWSSKRTTKSNENKKPVQPKSPNQEQVIALLKRIQSSIAKQRHQRTADEETLKEETKSKGKANSNIEGDQVMKSGIATKDITQQVSVTETEYRPMRPPSKFERQSPIPFASAPRDGTLGVKKEEDEPQVEDKIEDMKLPVIGKMKLPELKELAKSRGIKGYSKLKKNELQELLQS